MTLNAKGLSYNAAVKGRKKYKRSAGKLSELAGGDTMAYVETNRSRNKELKKDALKKKSVFFKKLDRDREKKRKEENDARRALEGDDY